MSIVHSQKVELSIKRIPILVLKIWQENKIYLLRGYALFGKNHICMHTSHCKWLIHFTCFAKISESIKDYMNSFCLVGYNFEEQLTIFFLRFTKLHFIAKQNGCCGVCEKNIDQQAGWQV